MLLRWLTGFYMPGGDFSSFEARYSFLPRLRGPYFGYFLFAFSNFVLILVYIYASVKVLSFLENQHRRSRIEDRGSQTKDDD